MSKIVIKERQKNEIMDAAEILVGTVFTASLKMYPDSHVFMRTFTNIVDLEHPECTWTELKNRALIFENFQEVNLELVIS